MKILSLPIGHFMARILPNGILNPGPFSMKEHVLITIFAGAAGGHPHGMDIVVAHRSKSLLYNPDVNFWNSLAFVTITQMIGFGLAG
jgi:hypothetical protein